MFGSLARDAMIKRAFPAGASSDVVMPAMIPGYGSGTFNMDGTKAAPANQQPTKRSTAQRIAGYLADALAGASGREGPYSQMLQREGLMQQKSQQEQAQRAAEYADFVKREEYKRANPSAPNNDTVADYEFIRANLGEEAAKLFLQNRADPPQYRQGPDGQFYRIETAQPQVLGTTLPEGWTIEGGTAGNSGGNFR